MDFGDSISGLQNIQVIASTDAEELQAILKGLTLPTHIISIYGQNGRHYAWILTQHKVVKKEKKKKE